MGDANSSPLPNSDWIDRLVYGEQVRVPEMPPLTHIDIIILFCEEKKCPVTFTSRCSWWLVSLMWRQEQFLFILIFPCSSKVI
jgi:hypothetical protein